MKIAPPAPTGPTLPGTVVDYPTLAIAEIVKGPAVLGGIASAAGALGPVRVLGEQLAQLDKSWAETEKQTVALGEAIAENSGHLKQVLLDADKKMSEENKVLGDAAKGLRDAVKSLQTAIARLSSKAPRSKVIDGLLPEMEKNAGVLEQNLTALLQGKGDRTAAIALGQNVDLLRSQLTKLGGLDSKSLFRINDLLRTLPDRLAKAGEVATGLRDAEKSLLKTFESGRKAKDFMAFQKAQMPFLAQNLPDKALLDESVLLQKAQAENLAQRKSAAAQLRTFSDELKKFTRPLVPSRKPGPEALALRAESEAVQTNARALAVTVATTPKWPGTNFPPRTPWPTGNPGGGGTGGTGGGGTGGGGTGGSTPTEPSNELWIRAYPDEVAVTHLHELNLSPAEDSAARDFWTGYYAQAYQGPQGLADGEALLVLWRKFVSLVGQRRAEWAYEQLRPTNLGTLSQGLNTGIRKTPQFPTLAAQPRKSASLVMPNHLLFALYATEQGAPKEVWGNRIPDQLETGFDPNDPQGFGLDANGNLSFPPGMRWMADFPEAVRVGMAVRVPLTKSEYDQGFAKVVVVGAKEGAGQTLLGQAVNGTPLAQHLLSTLFTAHKASAKGLELLAQGTPTNNTGHTSSGFSAKPDETPEAQWARLHAQTAYTTNAAHAGTPEERRRRPDGVYLAHALGFAANGERFWNNLRGGRGTDQRDAYLANAALWHGTIGNYLTDALAGRFPGELSPLRQADIDGARRFFLDHVSGRGNLPVFRVGNQPYGVLTLTDLDRAKPGTAFLAKLRTFLVDYLWKGLSIPLWQNNNAGWNLVPVPRNAKTTNGQGNYTGKWDRLVRARVHNIESPYNTSDVFDNPLADAPMAADRINALAPADQVLARHQARFMRLLGQLPRSVEHFVRYSITNLVSNNGTSAIVNGFKQGVAASLSGPTRVAGAYQGVFDPQNQHIALYNNLFSQLDYAKTHEKLAFLVCDGNLSETEALATGENYIAELLSSTQPQNGQLPPRPQTKALLAHLLYQSWAMAFWESAAKALQEQCMPDNLREVYVQNNQILTRAGFYRILPPPAGSAHWSFSDQPVSPPSAVELQDMFARVSNYFANGYTLRGQLRKPTLQDIYTFGTGSSQAALNILGYDIFNDPAQAATSQQEALLFADMANVRARINWDAVHASFPAPAPAGTRAFDWAKANAVNPREFGVGVFNIRSFKAFVKNVKTNTTGNQGDPAFTPYLMGSANNLVASGTRPFGWLQNFVDGAGNTNVAISSRQTRLRLFNLFTERPDKLYFLTGNLLRDVMGQPANAPNMLRLLWGSLPTANDLADLRETLAAMDLLKDLPTAKLQRVVAEHLDLGSHRLDAWVLGLADRMIDELRRTNASNLTYPGAYGYVENLRPGAPRTVAGTGAAYLQPASPAALSPVCDDPDIQGYIHAPSLAHATAAAVMRAAYLNIGGKMLQVDLSSARVRRALYYIEGMRGGQSINGLLGYEMERALQNTAPAMGQYLPALRDRYPLVAGQLNTTAGTPAAEEAMPAVLDGLALLRDFEGRTPASRDAHIVLSLGGNPPADHVGHYVAALNTLSNSLDAVADLLLSEGVFQAVQGNYARANAVMKALSGGQRPPEISIVETPRTGFTFTHRVAMLREAGGPANLTPSLRTALSPSLDAWAEHLLQPGTLGANVVLLEDGEARITTPVAATELPIGSSDLLYLLADGALGTGRAELDMLFIAQVATAAGLAEDKLQVDYDNYGSGKPLGLVVPMARQAVRMLGASQPIRPGQLAARSSQRTARHTWDLALVHQLVDDAQRLLQSKHDRLAAGLPDLLAELPGAVLGAVNDLQSLSGLGFAESVPLRGPDTPAETVYKQVGLLLPQLETRLSQSSRLLEQNQGETDEEAVLVNLQKAAGALCGGQMHLFPSFALDNAPELQTALANTAAILPATPLPMERWLHGAARVRENLARFENLSLYAELAGLENAPTLQALQVPYTPGDRWLGLEVAPERRNTEKLSLVLGLQTGAFSEGVPYWGFLVDEWVESIPDADITTGLAVNYDQPNAKPPQSLLLAVHPEALEPGNGNWTKNDLLAMVHNAVALAKLRAVEPDFFSHPESADVAVSSDAQGKPFNDGFNYVVPMNIAKASDETLTQTYNLAADQNQIQSLGQNAGEDLYIDFGQLK